MALNKALAILVCSIFLLSAIVMVAPVKAAPSTESSSVANFTLTGWVWGLDYAQDGIGNATLTVTNGQVTYNSNTQTWSFNFPNCQLTFTFEDSTTQTPVSQTLTINLVGSETESIFQLGELDYPTSSSFSGVWLSSGYIAIIGYIYLPPISGGVLKSASPYYFAMKTPNVNIPFSTSYNNGFAGGIDSIINNSFILIDEFDSQVYQLRGVLSSVLYELMVLFSGVRNLITPYIP